MESGVEPPHSKSRFERSGHNPEYFIFEKRLIFAGSVVVLLGLSGLRYKRKINE